MGIHCICSLCKAEKNSPCLDFYKAITEKHTHYIYLKSSFKTMMRDVNFIQNIVRCCSDLYNSIKKSSQCTPKPLYNLSKKAMEFALYGRDFCRKSGQTMETTLFFERNAKVAAVACICCAELVFGKDAEATNNVRVVHSALLSNTLDINIITTTSTETL